MAHLHLVPAPIDYDAEAARLKQEILNRGGVRLDMRRARQVARERLLALGEQIVTEDDGDAA